MLRTLCLATTVLLLPPGHASADAGPDLSRNAALKYWQAFAQLPKLTDAEQNKLFADDLTMPLDAHARELVTKTDYALRMMYQGAAAPRCDWGIDWEEGGMEVLLPQLRAAKVLSVLACLRARLRFEEGHNADAVADLVAAIAMGRHASLDGSFIGVLVGYSIEARVGEVIALYLPGLSAETIEGLKKRLDALPPGSDPALALRNNGENILNWFVHKVKQAKDPDRLLAVLGPLLGERQGKGGDAAAEARAFFQECGGTTAGVVRRAEEVRPAYALLATKLDLPLDQFEVEADREAKKRAGNPVFKLFFPRQELIAMRRARARAEVRRALLQAAIAVKVDGRDALKQHPDPVVGGPFEYVPFKGGFELRSKLRQQDDKPVTLTVGRRSN
jgi:hypothetical protein